MKDDSHNDEHLAMLLDAKLSPRVRERLLSEVADDPELLAVLAGASAGLGTVEPSAQGVSPGRRSVRRLLGAPVWLAAAAAIVIALLFGVWRFLPGTAQAERALALVERIDAQRPLPGDWSDPSWNRTRGSNDAFDHAGSSVMLGARAADLTFAQRHAPDRAHDIATAMSDLARGIPGSGPALAAWESAWRVGSDSSEAIRDDALGALEQLADPGYFALGAVLEGLRIAILSGDTASLSSFASELRAWTPPAEASDRVRATIAALAETLELPGLTQQNANRLLRDIDDGFLAVFQGPSSGSV